MWNRRQLLQQASTGFGWMALTGLLQGQAAADDRLPRDAALSGWHHRPRAKHVIFCYMSGGVSHVDSFDPKPELERWQGRPLPMKVERTQFNQNGQVMASPFAFKPAGQAGLPISSLFPQLATVADRLAVVRSMTTPFNEHAQGNYFVHAGFPFMGYPSAGAWCAYGLGTINQNLPSYVVLQSGGAVPPHGGVALFSNGFLPGHTQGSILQADAAAALPNLQPQRSATAQQRQLALSRQLNQQWVAEAASDDAIESAIRNYETAFRMQTAVPELCDLSNETQATLDLYGVGHANPTLSAYARQCLLARRLVEQGVRFVELSCLSVGIGAGGPRIHGTSTATWRPVIKPWRSRWINRSPP